MRSSFIDWLFEQSFRNDEVGLISRWSLSEPDFNPLEFHDILEWIQQNPNGTVDDKDEMSSMAINCFIEFAKSINYENAVANGEFKVIDDIELLKEKLDFAIKTENYEEAAKLRDQLKIMSDKK